MTKQEQDLVLAQAFNSWRHLIIEFKDKDKKHTQGWLKEYDENSITIRNIFGYKKYNRDSITQLAMETFPEVKKEPITFIDDRFPKGAFAYKREPQIDGVKFREQRQEEELARIFDLHNPHAHPRENPHCRHFDYIPYKDEK